MRSSRQNELTLTVGDVTNADLLAPFVIGLHFARHLMESKGDSWVSDNTAQ